MACCVDCKYGKYDSAPKSIGSNPDGDVWCVKCQKWVGTDGSCSQYKEK